MYNIMMVKSTNDGRGELVNNDHVLYRSYSHVGIVDGFPEMISHVCSDCSVHHVGLKISNRIFHQNNASPDNTLKRKHRVICAHREHYYSKL